LACLHDGRIGAFIVSTVLEDGSLCLHSLYAEKTWTKDLYGLLQTALRVLCERGGEGDALHVAAHNEAGLKIIEHLLQDAHEEAERNTVRSMVFYPHSERNLKEMEELENAMPVLDLLMPKLSGLSELMDALGIENDVVLPSDDLPFITAQPFAGAGAAEIRLAYVPTDEEDAGKYVLMATTVLPLPEESAGAGVAAQLCDAFNAGTLGPFAHSDPLGEAVYIRGNLPERDVPVTREQFEYFWELFKQGITDMAALIREDNE
jgi:hypothetical protein